MTHASERRTDSIFKKSARLPVALTGVLLLGGCVNLNEPLPMPASTPIEPVVAVAPEPPPPPPSFAQVGRASWYGDWHHGRKTASGERFNKNELTAAHRTLPLGTEARVTNLENGRAVEVLVNDRGPYIKGRVIDLSEAAAKELGMKEKGLARVMVEVIDEDAPSGHIETATVTQ
jgi:rare lipoprotein A